MANNRIPRWTTDPGAIPGEPYDYLEILLGAENHQPVRGSPALREVVAQMRRMTKRASALRGQDENGILSYDSVRGAKGRVNFCVSANAKAGQEPRF